MTKFSVRAEISARLEQWNYFIKFTQNETPLWNPRNLPRQNYLTS